MAVPQLIAGRRKSAAAAALLFERIPDRLFAPLASANRHRYWALLCRLHEKRFGPDAPLPPSQGFLVREIVQDIEDELLTQDLWESDEGYAPDTPINIRANMVFYRIEDAGWLRVEKIGVEKRVQMRPAVSQFLTLLVAFAETGPVFVSGKIRSIDLNIQQVLLENAEGDTLAEAAEQARHLLEHVRNTGMSVRSIMESLSAETTTAAYVRRFFGDYIERVFIGDYRELRTKEHPLSRRQQILRAVDEIGASDAHRARLIGWYAAKRCSGDRVKAERLFERDIYRLLELSRIDEYLDRLDDEIRRANRRALAYIDYRLRALRPVEHLIKQGIEAALAGRLPVLGCPFPAGDLIGGERLAEPRKPIDRAPPSSLRAQRPSEESIARARVMLRVRDMLSVPPPPRLAQYVAGSLAPGARAPSGALPMATVPDVRAYQTLASLALAMSSDSRRLQLQALANTKGFRVAMAETDEPEGAPISGRSFLIERRAAPAGSKST